jgi:hypothetical protein
LLNSPFVIEVARALAERVAAEHRGDERQVVAALYRILYQRGPEREELEQALAFWRAPSTADVAKPADKAPTGRLTRWEELAQVLLLANEVAFVD